MAAPWGALPGHPWGPWELRYATIPGKTWLNRLGRYSQRHWRSQVIVELPQTASFRITLPVQPGLPPLVVRVPVPARIRYPSNRLPLLVRSPLFFLERASISWIVQVQQQDLLAGGGILVSRQQFPHLYECFMDVCRILG